MHNIDLIVTLTGGLAAALALGYLTNRAGLSPIVGYLLAGIVVGPNTPGFVADERLAEQLAEFGVILLMFGVGLHFHLEDLIAVRGIAVPGAIVQSLVATGLGAVAAWLLGWGWTAGLVFGMALSVASTVVLTRVLSDHNELHTPVGHIAIGWLVVEDLFTVMVLVLLPALFGGGGGAGGLATGLLLAALKIGVLVFVTFVVGGRVVPWLLTKVAQSRSRELFTLTVLVVALGIAVASAVFFGVSMALGAFLAGMVVGRSEFSLRAAAEALPMRDAFAVLFFVSAGMLFDPAYLWQSPVAVAATLAVVMIGKPTAAILLVLLFRHPVRVALAVAAALAQIGEFSFMLAVLGLQLKVLPEAANNALIAAAIISISANPLVFRTVGPIERWLARRPRLWRIVTARAQGRAETGESHRDDKIDPRYRAVVIGYGPVGRTVARLLRENRVEPTIVEMNLETVHRLRAEGIPAVYGDAGRRETLEQAGVARAATLVMSASSIKGAREVVRLARELNPDVRIISRSAYLRERAELLKAGVGQVFTGEGEVAMAMTEAVLVRLGASAEQIDRERARVHEELFGAEEDVHTSRLLKLPQEDEPDHKIDPGKKSQV
jgi:CPA2 family monovalent cation:H+ antiporter-2